MVALAVTGESATLARLARARESLFADAKRALTQQSQALQARVRQKLDGEILQIRTGRLRDSISTTVTADGDLVTATIGVDAVPYAAIQEFGGVVHIPEIVPEKAKALAFAIKGEQIFAKRVRAHDVTIPPHFYLRGSLAEMRDEIVGAMRDAMNAATDEA